MYTLHILFSGADLNLLSDDAMITKAKNLKVEAFFVLKPKYELPSTSS